MDLNFLLLERFEGEKVTGSITFRKIMSLTESQQEVYLRYHNHLLSELEPVDGTKAVERTKEMTDDEYIKSVRSYEFNMKLSPFFYWSSLFQVTENVSIIILVYRMSVVFI